MFFKSYIQRVWNPVGDFEIFTRENGFFLVKFKDTQDCSSVLKNGPYFYNGKLIIVRKRSDSLKMDIDLLTTMPIWVRLPCVNLKLWDREAFSVMASIIGKPIKMDAATTLKTRLNYARLLVEVSANDELPDEINLTLCNGENVIQKVEYEWVPPKCNLCKCFGHTREQCNPKQTWIPKTNNQKRDIIQEDNTGENQEPNLNKKETQARNQKENDRINQESIISDQENNIVMLTDQEDQITAMVCH